MPTRCCVPGCATSGGHKFPTKDVDLHMKWRVAIKRSDEKKGLWKPGPNDVVCHQHFITSDYKDTLLGKFQEKKVEIFLLLFPSNKFSVECMIFVSKSRIK